MSDGFADAAERLAALDAVVSALAHPARRQILLTVHLCGGETTAGHVASRFSHAWPTTTRHLKVLEDAGLLRHRKEGRNRVYALDRSRLALAREWLDWFDRPPPPPEAFLAPFGPVRPAVEALFACAAAAGWTAGPTGDAEWRLQPPSPDASPPFRVHVSARPPHARIACASEARRDQLVRVLRAAWPDEEVDAVGASVRWAFSDRAEPARLVPLLEALDPAVPTRPGSRGSR